jgi:hypothetical protein
MKCVKTVMRKLIFPILSGILILNAEFSENTEKSFFCLSAARLHNRGIMRYCCPGRAAQQQSQNGTAVRVIMLVMPEGRQAGEGQLYPLTRYILYKLNIALIELY